MRRRIVEEGEQLELPIPSVVPPLRRRLSLNEETVTLRVPKETAEIVEGIPRSELVQALESFADDQLYTEWSSDRPPCAGWWQIKQRNVHDAVRLDWPRMWYAPSIDAWLRGVPVQTSDEARAIPHSEFIGGFQYRGLKQPWPAGYDYELERTPGQPAPRRHVDL